MRVSESWNKQPVRWGFKVHRIHHMLIIPHHHFLSSLSKLGLERLAVESFFQGLHGLKLIHCMLIPFPELSIKTSTLLWSYSFRG